MMIIKEDFIALEKALLTSEVRSSQERLNELLHDDFIEYSQSGTQYGKAEVLIAFQNYKSNFSEYETFGFEVRILKSGNCPSNL